MRQYAWLDFHGGRWHLVTGNAHRPDHQMMDPKGEFDKNIGSVSWSDQAAFGFDFIIPLMRSGPLNLRLDYFGGHISIHRANGVEVMGSKDTALDPKL